MGVWTRGAGIAGILLGGCSSPAEEPALDTSNIETDRPDRRPAVLVPERVAADAAPRPPPEPGGSARRDPGPDAGPDALATWAECAEDASCASAVCGCNGAAVRRCLPDETYPRACAAPLPNWERCTGDDACASRRCGCNGSARSGTGPYEGERCLPGPSYPRTCT